MGNLKKNIRAFMLNNFLLDADESALADDASFLDQGIIDSTGILELINWIEDTFSIQISDEEMLPKNFDSINKILAFIETKTAPGVADAYL